MEQYKERYYTHLDNIGLIKPVQSLKYKTVGKKERRRNICFKGVSRLHLRNNESFLLSFMRLKSGRD